MKKITAEEILLVSSTKFAKRDFASKDPGEETESGLGPIERLELACWQGLLDEFIQSSPVNQVNGDKLFMWKIHVTGAFVCVELGQVPQVLEKYYSLNPELCLLETNMN